MAVDPMRRRLTVGTGNGSVMGAAAVASAGQEVHLAVVPSNSPIEDLFRQAQGSKQFACCITSTNDSQMQMKKAFGDKDMEIMCSDEAMDAATVLQNVRENYNVAWKCHKGHKPESPNQDSFSICVAENEFALYGVYDGHGPLGHDVSDKARLLLVEEFLSRRQAGSITSAFKEAFVATQNYFKDVTEASNSAMDASLSGTTATLAYHDMGAGQLYIAHVGDSRSVLANGPKFEEMTVDHKPNLDEERRRIESRGGRVIFDGWYNYRVFARDSMIPGLNMSRALGDVKGHEVAGLSAEPDIKVVDLSEYSGDVVLLLCTDGVWEFVESKQAVDMLRCEEAFSTQALQEKLSELTKHSWNMWMKDSENELSDDITGIAVRVKTAKP